MTSFEKKKKDGQLTFLTILFFIPNGNSIIWASLKTTLLNQVLLNLQFWFQNLVLLLCKE